MSILILLSITGIAMICDLKTGKIPNRWIAAGWIAGFCMQVISSGIAGIFSFLSGTAVPLLLLGILFYFRMLGAGDIKLLAVIGGFLGISTGIKCMTAAFLLGGLYSLFLLVKRGILKKRLLYFFAYISNYFQTRQWKPYRQKQESEAGFCFSVPVFISVALIAGGCI